MPEGQVANLASEVTITTGAGVVTLAQRAGFARFSQRFAVGARVAYKIEDGDNWEVGLGTVGAANTLARTTVYETYVGGALTTTGAAAINLAAGNKYVIHVAPTQALAAPFAGAELALYSAFGGL